MNLLARIHSDLNIARKSRSKQKITILSTLYSECAIVGKNKANRESTDQEVIQKVKSFLKAISENILYVEEESLQLLNFEKNILSSYLPRQLSEQELSGIISDFIKTSDKVTIGSIMGQLNQKFSGKFDGKLASRILKESL